MDIKIMFLSELDEVPTFIQTKCALTINKGIVALNWQTAHDMLKEAFIGAGI